MIQPSTNLVSEGRGSLGQPTADSHEAAISKAVEQSDETRLEALEHGIEIDEVDYEFLIAGFTS